MTRLGLIVLLSGLMFFFAGLRWAWIAVGGGLVMGAAFLALALTPVWGLAPVAVFTIGFGFYMLHNTLQTVGTQMTPQARGTSVSLFASVYFLGQTAGAFLAAPVVDRFGAPPLFVVSAIGLPLLAFWFSTSCPKPAANSNVSLPSPPSSASLPTPPTSVSL